jgi:ubiquinone/menaquinone biosynthesis C-methylase UbiE
MACPLDGTSLRSSGGSLACERNHEFAIEEEVPVFASDPRREFEPQNHPPCAIDINSKIEPFVNNWIVNTNGNLYWKVRGKLPRYPIPRWPFENGEGKTLVDLGCGWGRWCLAAAGAGFQPVGVDVHLDALQAATRVSKQSGKNNRYLCADIEKLPFRSNTMDMVFSYSVLQHLDRAKVERILSEAARILKPGGVLHVQLPNVAGVYSTIQRMKRGFREARSGTFEMRYWSKRLIRETLQTAGFKDTKIEADGYFSQNPQLTDLDLLSTPGKLVVMTSYAGTRIASAIPFFTAIADSLWVTARKPSQLRAEPQSAPMASAS